MLFVKEKIFSKTLLPISSKFTKHKAWDYYRNYKNSDYIDSKNRKRRKWKSLKNIITHAYENVEFYKKKFEENDIKPKDITSWEDIKKIPITTKNELRNNFPDKLIAKNYKNKVRFTNTSGTTGRPTMLAQDIDDVNYKFAAKLRSRNLYGLEEGYSVLRIAPNECQPVKKDGNRFESKSDYINEMLRDTKNSIYALLENSAKKMFYDKKVLYPIARNKIDENIENELSSRLKQIKKIEPDVLSIYPIYAYWLARYIEKENLSQPNVNVIDFTGGLSTDVMRKKIEQNFQTKTYQNYGGCEFGRYASQCNVKQQNSMHILEEHCHVEFIRPDETYANEKEMSNIITTSLTNYGMPLIRVEHGDVGWYMNKKCSCGRTSRLMNVEGRIQSIIFNDQNKIITPGQIYNILFNEEIDYFKVIQKNSKRLTIKIVNLNENELNEEKLKRKFRGLLGKKVSVKFRYVNELKSENSNKYMFVKSNTYSNFRPESIRNKKSEIN